MGKRSGVRTAVELFVAFRRQRSWTQAELARTLDVNLKTVRRWLNDMCEAGIPLVCEDDDPPHVYWSVPRHWYPEGTLIPSELVREMCQQLARAPQSTTRNSLLDRLNRLHSTARAPTWTSGVLSDNEERALTTIEQAQRAKCAVLLKYVSIRSGQSERLVSVHHVASGFPVRFLAHDHQTRATRWFRLDSVHEARLHTDSALPLAAKDVERMVSESVDGFHDGNPPVEHRFFVQYPDSLWVKKSLLAPMQTESREGGIVVTAKVAGVTQIARFVVGLGAVARPLTDELREAVRRLAEEALFALPRPKQS